MRLGGCFREIQMVNTLHAPYEGQRKQSWKFTRVEDNATERSL